MSIRVVYETVAMAAEYDGKNFPPFSAFWEVKTRDLSPTGISFYSRRRPETELLMLMLGNPQATPLFLVARVCHCDAADIRDERIYKVGCELVKRIST